MTNSLAIGLGLVIAAAIALNFFMGWEAHLFLGHKLLLLIEWMAFWR